MVEGAFPPCGGNARCSLLGQRDCLMVGEPLGEIPKLPVQADILIEAGNGAGAREATSILAPLRPVALSAANQMLLSAIENVPEVVARVVVAAAVQKPMRIDRSFAGILKAKLQRGFRKGCNLRAIKLALLERLNASGDGRNLVEQFETGVNHFIRSETAVTDADALKRCVRDNHAVATNKPEQTGVQLIRAGTVV